MAPWATAGRPDTAADGVNALVFALVAMLYAVLVPGDAIVLAVVVAVGTVSAFLLRRSFVPGGREAALLVTVGVIVVVTALAPLTLGASALAAFAAVVTLLWAAADPRSPNPLRYRVSGILLPGLAAAIAVVVSAVLEGTTGLVVGVATALVLAVVFWVAYVLTRPDPFRVDYGRPGESS